MRLTGSDKAVMVIVVMIAVTIAFVWWLFVK
jgi:hypothetical protein